MDSDASTRPGPLPDVQAGRAQAASAPLRRVGVRDVRRPVEAFGASTVARIELGISLAAEARGAHMSRFAEALEALGPLTPGALAEFLGDLQRRLEATEAEARFSFPLFLPRHAPVSGARGLLDVDAELFGVRGAERTQLGLAVEVSVASLCPCSRAVSDYGAHNQRGRVRMEVTLRGDAAPEVAELVAIAERHASAPVYPALKREDERAVTMAAYDHPAFVEDMVRGVARELREDPRLAGFRVRVVNAESIHPHDVFAEVVFREGRFLEGLR
ncbi:MAG: GTP cyclohydrolase FolE2 [Myxococcota bacterium]